MALEDRFEVLKEIGDGSFGSVVLARVRTAGAAVARRGTVVSTAAYEAKGLWLRLTRRLDCDQNHEEVIRLIFAMSRVEGSGLSANVTDPRPSGSRLGHLPRPIH